MTAPAAAQSERVFEKEFSVPLAEHDLAQLAEEQAQLHNRRELLKDQKRTALAGFKQQFNGIDDRLAVIAEEVTNLSRKVKVKCERVPHPTAPRWQIIRLDNHQVVDELPMDIDEIAETRDSRLPLHHNGDGVGAADDEDEPRDLTAGGADDDGQDDHDGDGKDEGGGAGSEDEADADEEPAAAPAAAPAPKAASKAKGGAKGAKGGAEKKPRGKIECPFVLEQKDLNDPTKDVVCGAPGISRCKGFCKPHWDLTGGSKGNGTQALCILRRKNRQRLLAEKDGAPSDPSQPDLGPLHGDGVDPEELQ